MIIRPASEAERDNIQHIHLQAFPESESEQVAALAVNLLNAKTSPETRSLVAEQDGTLVGHIAFSPLFTTNSENWQGYVLAPLAVKPDHQRCGVGASLIKEGIGILTDSGVNMLFVYGDPDYYGRSGFSVEDSAGYLPPYDLQYPFGWQAMILNSVHSAELPLSLSCVDALNYPQLW